MTQKTALNLIIISFLSFLFLLVPVSQTKAQCGPGGCGSPRPPTPWDQTPGPTQPDSNDDSNTDQNTEEEAKEKCKDLDLTGPFTEVDHDQVFKIYDRANQFFGTTVFDREKGVQGYITSFEDRFLYQNFYREDYADYTDENSITYQLLEKEQDAVYKVLSRRWESITNGIVNPQEDACLKTIAGYGAEIGGTDNPITPIGSLEGCSTPDIVETANQLGDKVNQLDYKGKKQLLRLYLAHAYRARRLDYDKCLADNSPEGSQTREEAEQEREAADRRGMPGASGGGMEQIAPVPKEEQEKNPLLYVFKLIIRMLGSWGDKGFAILINWGYYLLDNVYI